MAEAAEVDAPPVVLETAKATVAVAKVSKLDGAAIEVPGGSTIAFPAVGMGGGGADIKVVAFKGNPFESAGDIECTERNPVTRNLVRPDGVEDPNCKEPLSAAVLSAFSEALAGFEGNFSDEAFIPGRAHSGSEMPHELHPASISSALPQSTRRDGEASRLPAPRFIQIRSAVFHASLSLASFCGSAASGNGAILK